MWESGLKRSPVCIMKRAQLHAPPKATTNTLEEKMREASVPWSTNRLAGETDLSLVTHRSTQISLISLIDSYSNAGCHRVWQAEWAVMSRHVRLYVRWSNHWCSSEELNCLHGTHITIGLSMQPRPDNRKTHSVLINGCQTVNPSGKYPLVFYWQVKCLGSSNRFWMFL